MQITRLEPPINGGILFWVQAVSTRGRRYDFLATMKGEVASAFRGEALGWLQVKAPSALKQATRAAIRKAVTS